MKKKEITTLDLFEAIGTFSEEVMHQFAGVRSEMSVMRTDINILKSDVNHLKLDMKNVKLDIKELQKNMATKEDIKNLMVHGDLRLNMLIGRLVEEKVLAPAKVADILRFRPLGA